MSLFPTTFSEHTLALEASQFGEDDKAFISQLAEKGYEVHAGLTTELAEAISKMCLEPSIKEYCPNDSGRRFKNHEATENWLANGRAVFLLLKREAELLTLVGYGWIGSGPSPHVPSGEATFAIRVGEAGQGQGLATPFSRLIVAGAAVLYGAKNIWLETWASNGGAVHVYHKIGFVDVDQQADERLNVSGEKIADIRLYMSLPNELLPPINDSALSSVS